jgi:aryl-alcohol dehydrogenase-like predicted oxidoreductase
LNYRLGRSALVVSVVGFGTTQLRRVPEKQAVEALQRAFALGRVRLTA